MSKVFEIVTQRIIAMLEKGVIPWRRPWKGAPPQNLITRKPYRGINAFILGFSGSYFLTFNQAKALGAHVKKGAQGLPVVFWKFSNIPSSSRTMKTPKARTITPLQFSVIIQFFASRTSRESLKTNCRKSSMLRPLNLSHRRKRSSSK